MKEESVIKLLRSPSLEDQEIAMEVILGTYSDERIENLFKLYGQVNGGIDIRWGLEIKVGSQRLHQRFYKRGDMYVYKGYTLIVVKEGANHYYSTRLNIKIFNPL